MLTIRGLLADPALGLALAAGSEGLDNPIRFAHTSELRDPTPWLSGGELLLTTGMALSAAHSSQRAYVRRLVHARLAGLGFGLGFGFDEVPSGIRDAAAGHGFPVLEVPYPVPFIAITEAIAARLTEDRVREAQMSVEVHERLTTMVRDGTGPADVLDLITELTGGWALLFGRRGDVLARSQARVPAPQAPAVWSELPPALWRRSGTQTASDLGPRGARLALPVVSGGRTEAVLAFGRSGRVEQRDRIVVRHAVTALGLLLSVRRAVIDAERRIAGDFVCEAIAGRLRDSDLERRLELAGFPAGAPLTVLVVAPAKPAAGDALEELARTVDATLGARSGAARTARVDGHIVALVASADSRALADAVFEEVGDAIPSDGGAPVRVGVGHGGALAVRESYRAALFALRATPPERAVATSADLGSYRFLLEAATGPTLDGFATSVLGPLLECDRTRSTQLVDSVRAYIAGGGRWERGAQRLGVHRHTLRYRVRRAEELLGRDLSSGEDRLEVWLALRALEVLGS